MRSAAVTSLARLGGLLLAVGAAGCNAFGITGEDENEVRVEVVAVGADYLDADDDHRYRVTDETEFERVNGFADVSVGETVEIEWEAIADSDDRLALEIEGDGPDDD